MRPAQKMCKNTPHAKYCNTVRRIHRHCRPPSHRRGTSSHYDSHNEGRQRDDGAKYRSGGGNVEVLLAVLREGQYGSYCPKYSELCMIRLIRNAPQSTKRRMGAITTVPHEGWKYAQVRQVASPPLSRWKWHTA